MIPIKDDNPTESFAWVTYTIILLNILVFGYEILLSLNPPQLNLFIHGYAMIPRNIVQGRDLYTLFSAMFLHGSFMHLFGNMLYLHIFGDNIEDDLGHRNFILFYLASGLVASSVQIWVNPNSSVPNLGASGAVAGVLGAYLLRYPRAKVHTLVFLGYLIEWITLPAIVVLGFWFVLQLFYGIGSLAYMSATTGGGVAFFAHVGGFIAGMILIKILL
ncbi:MAG: rhomboid family intramembrane serine protease [Candidatus Hydrothermarchaeales archaeon]